MNNKAHVHVEATLVSLIFVAILGLIDWFVDVYDGHEYKIFGYLAVFFVCYLLASVLIRKLWEKE